MENKSIMINIHKKERKTSNQLTKKSVFSSRFMEPIP